MTWFKKVSTEGSIRQRVMILLGMTISFLMIFLTIAVATMGHTYAQQKDTAVLSTKIDDMQISQKDLKETVSNLGAIVADLRDKQNLQMGMIIGFGGLAALLQIVQTLLLHRGDKNAKG